MTEVFRHSGLRYPELDEYEETKNPGGAIITQPPGIQLQSELYAKRYGVI